MSSTPTDRAIDAVWRIESAKIIAGLTRMVRDVGLAEELAQDALVAALEQWPQSGIPDNPGAWLTAAAKHRAIDHFRRNKLLERKHQELGRELEAQQELAVPDLDAALDDDVGDDLLRLVFISCHPVLVREARVALNLSQEQLAKALGISFQQIQNYEKGANGVSAVRLFDICKILSVSLASMFPQDSPKALERPFTQLPLNKPAGRGMTTH